MSGEITRPGASIVAVTQHDSGGNSAILKDTGTTVTAAIVGGH